MIVKLVDGARSVEIIADDEMVKESLFYATIFERNVKVAVAEFYKEQTHDAEATV